MIISEHSYLDDALKQKVLTLVQVAQDYDMQSPLSEHVLLHLKHGGDTHSRHLVGIENNEVIGYVHLDLTDEVAGPSAQVVVHPEFRNLGYGKQLLEGSLSVAGKKLRLWSHGENTLARNLARSVGMKEVRTLFQMRRSLLSAIESASFSSDYQLSTFNFERDADEWICANSQIFIAHPEQGSWTMRDFEIRMKEDWFDPVGFFILRSNAQIAGFGWTKVHRHSHSENHSPLGEIYVLGVMPEHRGKSLGKSLTLHCLTYLRSLELLEAMLYVNKEDATAVALYESCGFRIWDIDTLYSF